MSPKYLLGLSTFEYIHAIDAYIFWESFYSVFLSDALYIFVNLYENYFGLFMYQRTLFFEFPGFEQSANPLILWSTSEARIRLYIGKFSIFIFGLRGLKDKMNFLLPFLSMFLKNISVGCDPPQRLHFERANVFLSVVLTELSKFK